jgi:hypothetical protein
MRRKSLGDWQRKRANSATRIAGQARFQLGHDVAHDVGNDDLKWFTSLM